MWEILDHPDSLAILVYLVLRVPMVYLEDPEWLV